MENTQINVAEVLNLCKQFKQTTEALIQNKPELMPKAEAAYASRGEALQEKMEALEDMASDLPFFVDEETANQWVADNEEFQKVSAEFMEEYAKAISEIMKPYEIMACMPEGLLGSKAAMEFFDGYGATAMSQACVNIFDVTP